MSAAENVRSFWLAKTRTESPTSTPRLKEGPTMEGLRSTLHKNKPWEAATHVSRIPTSKSMDMLNKKLSTNTGKERDQVPSPASSPTFGRPSPFAKETILNTQNIDSPSLSRPSSPHKSAMASPELGPRTLARAKSVTFNESLEVRHMSECSFEEASSPFSANSDTDDNECSLDDMSDIDDDIPQRWADNAQILDGSTTRALTVISGPRPLPSVPVKLANSPETRVLATEQENRRKPFSGLGLNLASPPRDQHDNERLESASTYNADEAMIRRNSQRDLLNASENDESEDDSNVGASVKTAVILDLSVATAADSNKVGTTPMSRMSPALKSFVARSPEPAISREHIREKLAQRKAAKESARLEQKCEALTPHQTLAPPLPHYDSFVRASTAIDDGSTSSHDSSDDSATTAMVVPQRKVSDTHRPTTPVEKITDIPPEPQSGRAVHHDREKRVSLDMSSVKPPPAPNTFTAINYDGDDYDDSDVEEFSDEPIIHEIQRPLSGDTLPDDDISKVDEHDAIVERAEKKEMTNVEDSPLRFLQEIPNVPEQGEPRAEIATPDKSTFSMKHMSLSLDFDSIGEDSLGMGLEQYMTPELRPETPITSRTVACESPGKYQSTKSQLDAWVDTLEGPNKENHTDPEPATITARGLKLRTRPSITPADATALAARRRQVSLEFEGHDQTIHAKGPISSQVRRGSVGDLSILSDNSQLSPGDEEQGGVNTETEDLTESIQPMAMPVLQPLTRELSFSDINNAFDRVMQKQKKGYVVRQQTRVVHATANLDDAEQADLESAKGHTRQSSSVYTTASEYSSKASENHKAHNRKGSRVPVGVQMSPKPRSTPNAPPQAALVEDLDGGRLFIRVMHVKQLTLPIPKGEESFFSCTLDNGKHCVTTPLHTLADTVKINQEFELIADHNLEFILTLQAQYVPPKMPVRPKSTLGRLLNSPKRHKPTGSITSLSLSGYVGDDGSFARAHLALKHFRNKAFGRPYTMLVPVLNEWAMETTGMTSKNVPQVRQRKPYKIGEIELQVLYVPPVTAEHRHALPTSLSQAVRDIRDAEWHTTQHCEGYLSQQGGDCPYWRRRHFKLVGSKLTAYHANTGQVRATINLAKATQVTDDKESLTRAEVTVGKGQNQKRRKSGFAEREEGHLYVADGFRIRFANGEVIDFYADSHKEKTRWVEILGSIVQKIPVAKAWCQIVLESESGLGSIAK